MNKLQYIAVNTASFIRRHGTRIISIVLLSMLFSLIPAPNKYFNPIAKTGGILHASDVKLPPAPPVPVNRTSVAPLILSAQGVVIKDIPSGMVLYAKNDEMRFPPASTTKIMTALIALSHYELDDVLTVRTVVDSGRLMDLESGEKLSAEALLYGTLVHSANDAAYTLAENYPGGVEEFVAAMNKRAKELYLETTNFTNPIGFDDPNQYTSAQDLTKLAIIALSDKTFAKIVGTLSITVSDVDFTHFHDLRNVNELLGKIAGVAGVKTGYTEIAGEILVSEVRKNGQIIVITLLKSSDRFGETEKLINWVFENFSWVPLESVTSAIQ